MFESRPITGNPQDYVGSLHERIEDRWLRTKGDVEEFTQELREFGGELLDELIPDKLQEILWVNRRRFTSIQVLATEPFIPWSSSCASPASRCRGDALPQSDGTRAMAVRQSLAAERLQVRPNRARYVIPDYPDRRFELPESQLERKFLEDTFGALPVEPQPIAFRKLISTRARSTSCTSPDTARPEVEAVTEARLLLQGRIEDGKYIEAPFDDDDGLHAANLTAADGARPLVVLNACQTGRLGYALTGISGFAQAFLNAGAGAFVGTQWSVATYRDGCSPRPSTKLLDGATVAEATVASREQARADGDATWLAYAVYAHPHARLVHQRSP